MAKSKSQGPDTTGSRFYNWLDERLALSTMAGFLSKKTVPQHKHSHWYYWGGITLTFLIVQFITGILLLIYYKPGPDAFESVKFITYELEFGWFIRGLHHWSANLMVLSVFIHMFSVFFMRAYRRPREFGWWTGVILLLFTLGFAFSGYLLPFDELSYFATKIGLDVAESIPLIGPPLAAIARGGTDVTYLTIQRFFTLHIMVLPLLILGILTIHLVLILKHGNASPPSEEAKPKNKRKEIKFFWDFFVKDITMWLLALNFLILVTILFPPQLGSPADPLSPAPEGIHPEWYFMSQYQFLKIFGNILPGAVGEIISIVLMACALLLWAIVPMIDNTGKAGKMAKAATYIGLLSIVILVVLTAWAYLAI